MPAPLPPRTEPIAICSCRHASHYHFYQGMRKNGATMDIQDWGRRSHGVMMAALTARAIQDSEFASILRLLRSMGVRLLHFERGGAKSYWGGSLKDNEIQGGNMLGKMMDTLVLPPSQDREYIDILSD